MNEYPHIKKLLELYNKAINSRTKDIRLQTNEVSLLLSDITKISINSTQQTETLKKIEYILSSLIQDDDDIQF